MAISARVHSMYPEDLRREIDLFLGVAAYSLLSWRGGAWRKCWHDRVIYN